MPNVDGKSEPYTCKDRLTIIEDYFEWYAILEDSKVCYFRMKIKGHIQA